MTPEHQERLTAHLERVASALVEATPEWWNSAVMKVQVKRLPDGLFSMPHEIWSEQYPRDIVVATDEVLAATRELLQVCEQEGQAWSTLIIRIEQVDDAWKHSTDFIYPDELGAIPGCDATE